MARLPWVTRTLRGLVIVGVMLGSPAWALLGLGESSGASPGATAGVSTLLAADGTPATGDHVVIEARDEPIVANPTGDQVLRLAGPVNGPASLDPSLARDIPTAFLARQVFRGLTRLDGDLEPVPELAERIEIAPNGLDYTFVLRDDATFQDGRLVAAEDVVFSLTHALDPDTAGGEAALLGGPTYLLDIAGAEDVVSGRSDRLTGLRALDTRTVAIRLTAPRATFLMKLAAAPAAIIDRRDVARGEAWWRSPNGTGPFKVVEWEPGERLVLGRSDHFFAGAPALERIEIRLGTNAFQPFNLYQDDQIDIETVPQDAIDRVLDPESLLRDEVVQTPVFALYYVAFRIDSPPMDDIHVRRAIQLAFPRVKVAEASLNGHAGEADGLIPDGMLGRVWSPTVPPFDPAAAEREIAASKYRSAMAMPTLTIYSAGGGPAEALRDVLQESLGLDVEVVSLDWPQFLDGLARRALPAYGLYWMADYPDPESLLWTLFGADSPDNYVDYRSPIFDGLLREAAAEPDGERRADLYQQAQQALLNDYVILPMYDDIAFTVAKPEVKNLEVTPLGILRLETVWLER